MTIKRLSVSGSEPVSSNERCCQCHAAYQIPDEHKPGMWLPEHYQMRNEFVRQIVARASPERGLQSPALRRFQNFIESNPRILMYFSHMFEEVPRQHPSGKDSAGGDRISDYKHMLAVLDYILRSAPDWTTAASGVGLVGLPMFAVMDSVLGTTNGYAAFLDPDVNVHIKDILDEWGMYLQSSASRHVLDTHELGWFCPAAIQALTRCANDPNQSNHKFDELYDCDSNDAHYGFKSWDDFFTRRIRTGVRPVAEPDDDDVLVHACESVAYNLEERVNLRDNFFVKGQPYSPQDMLANDPLAAYFARGTVYQAFLSALAYHRWHAPVSGVVRRAFVQAGTYFSLPSWMGVASMEDNPDRMVPSQSYLSAMATRGIVIIEADNREIGLVAFVAVGMSEVSTCDVTVREGQHVVKGDETGMFRFGGSSYCLLFRHGLRLDGLPDVQNEESCAVRSKFATVRR